MNELRSRLDRIRERVTSNEFLHGKGLGNEVPFYAFDYPPSEEPQVASHIEWLTDDLVRKTNLRVGNVHLLKLVVEQLKARGLYEKALVMEQAKGVPALLGALKGALEPRRGLDGEVDRDRSKVSVKFARHDLSDGRRGCLSACPHT